MKKGFALLGLGLLLMACETRPVTTAPPPEPMAAKPVQHAPAPPPPAPAKPAAPVRLATGEYMDNQENELRKRLRGDGLSVARLGDDIIIDMTDDFLFDGTSAGVSWDASDALNSIAAVLQSYDRTNVEIDSYTDTTGSADANLRVSQARARVIAGMLARDGVAEGRIESQGFGETHPKVPTGDNVNQPRNRRVEIRIIPHTDG